MPSRIRATTLATTVIVVALAAGACGETRRAVGEECLKNDDCLSGFCSARACVGAPVLLGGASSPPPSTGTGDAGTVQDTGIDAPADVQGG